MIVTSHLISVVYRWDAPHIHLHRLPSPAELWVPWDGGAWLRPPQHGRRKQRLCHKGRRLWAGGSATLFHFVSFSSAGNERWIRETPLGLKKMDAAITLMVTEKCARQHGGDPDISQGQVPAPSFHYICPGTRLETSKLPQNAVIAQKMWLTEALTTYSTYKILCLTCDLKPCSWLQPPRMLASNQHAGFD